MLNNRVQKYRDGGNLGAYDKEGDNDKKKDDGDNPDFF
jgi:hypothetical protein